MIVTRLDADLAWLFDTIVFIDLERGSSTIEAIFDQVRLERIRVCYSFVTFLELRLGRAAGRHWTEEERYRVLRPFPMVGLHPALERIALGYQAALEAQNAKRRDRLSLPGFNDCYIAAGAWRHGLRVLTRNTRHFTLLAGLESGPPDVAFYRLD